MSRRRSSRSTSTRAWTRWWTLAWSPGVLRHNHRLRACAHVGLGKAIGVPELGDHLTDRNNFSAAVDDIKTNTRVLAATQVKIRTCIQHSWSPGYPPMVPEELTEANLFAPLDGADIICFDVRPHETSLVVAEETSQRKLPILMDAERRRDGLDELLNLASYVAWKGVSLTPVALVSMLVRLPNIKFIIVTLGEKGCLMLKRSTMDASEAEEIDVESLLESLEQKVGLNSSMPKCIASKVWYLSWMCFLLESGSFGLSL
ncbi:hypothetical protein ABZP36_027036 [Zizania latifolia]